MKIVIGCDHGALELKETVKEVLKEFPEAEVQDMGTYTAESVDYPEIAEKVCKEIVNGSAEKGILLCGTGIGISMAANKIKGIRAALCSDVFSARMSREHNNANVLVMPARFASFETALKMVDTWLNTQFEGGRHQRRIEKIPIQN